MMIPNDIQQLVDRDFAAPAARSYVAERLATLWTTSLNVGPDQLARGILQLAAGRVEQVDKMFATNFYGDPRDLLMEAMGQARESSTGAGATAGSVVISDKISPKLHP